MDLVDGGDDPVLLELLPGQPPPLDHLGVLRRQHRVGHQQVDGQQSLQTDQISEHSLSSVSCKGSILKGGRRRTLSSKWSALRPLASLHPTSQ